MWPLMIDPRSSGAIAMDAWLVPRDSPHALARRRQQRLAALFQAARASPFYRRRFARYGNTLEAQPPVSKHELMAHIDDWVTDHRVSLAALHEFIADPARIGAAFAGEFVVWESSGSSGEPGIFVQDSASMSVYSTFEALRRPGGLSWQRCMDPFYLNERMAFVGATGGHFASTVSVERLRRVMPGMAQHMRGFSFLDPTPVLVNALNHWRPSVLATYPSAALLLAEEAAAGRLRIAPREVLTGGEALSDAVRGIVSQHFNCPVRGNYGASEFLAIASECQYQRLHLNSDWVLLEPVDEQGRPVPPGEPGVTTLLTNLVNHVQPLIRYDLGDRVRIDPVRCACGSVLPVIEVQGRIDDTLLLRDAQGRSVRLLPLALTTVLEDEAGVFDFQLVQKGCRSLSLTIAETCDRAALLRVRRMLRAYLRAQGLDGIELHVHQGEPAVQSRSGKRPRVVGLPTEAL
jgi:phenylacetate-coenzyme A ligase PaaK-like adenylate-forming protein